MQLQEWAQVQALLFEEANVKRIWRGMWYSEKYGHHSEQCW